MPRWWLGAGAAVVLFGLTVGSATVAPAANGGGIKQFGVSDVPGRATALVPGATGTRWVRLKNVENFPILVQTVSTTVGRPVDGGGRPVAACPASSVRVDALAAPVKVAGDGTADVALTTHLAPGAPACRGLTFPLTYTGTAVKS
ncbi:hypothetical protein [Amycolatopsis sp. cmx-4-68]|uniref:hypothetical protein n=1 Tax=Amycolatopsis sp. cmx-4-68 TaxID=2790938 RepID=UPI00397DBDA9